jgi:UDP-N-acetylmuramoylalanine--D-glutamate ligase
MVELVKKIVTGKSILILGFGMEGQSTYMYLRKRFPDIPVTIADANPDILKKTPHLHEDNHLRISSGENYLSNLLDYDLIIKSPGVSDDKLAAFHGKGILTSQTDLFLQNYRGQIIGVTGTKGKSTTSSLLYHIIHLYRKNSLLVGNIGLPPLNFIDTIDQDTVIIYEISSHQLEGVTCSPHIAILLNLYQEHLDHYASFEHYQSAKFNIARFQNENDVFIFNQDDQLILRFLVNLRLRSQMYGFTLSHPKTITRGCYATDHETIIFKSGHIQSKFTIGTPSVKGEHNFMNIMAVIAACKVSGIPDEFILEGIRTFKGLEHRMEYVGEYNGIHFYNDSIATVPEAAIYAIKALKNVDSIILGGHDRGIDYSGLIRYILETGIRNMIFIGDAGKRMSTILSKQKKHRQKAFLALDLEDAVRIAMRNTGKDMICLLSPAAASYGMFKDYKERGEVFKKSILESLL